MQSKQSRKKGKQGHCYKTKFLDSDLFFYVSLKFNQLLFQKKYKCIV